MGGLLGVLISRLSATRTCSRPTHSKCLEYDHRDDHTRSYPLSTFSVAEAKAHLGNLPERAEKGATIIIARRGEPVAQLAPVRTTKPGIDFARLRALRAAMPKAKTPADKLVRKMRDEKY